MASEIYCQSEEEFQAKVLEFADKGYVFSSRANASERERAGGQKYFYGAAGETLVRRVGKCGYCNRYVDVAGVRMHKRACEHCGETLCLDVVQGGKVRFSFREDNAFWDNITLIYHSDDLETNTMYFYADIPEQERQNRLAIEEASAKLEAFKDCYEIVEKDGEKLYAFHHSFRNFYLADEDKINIKDSGPGLQKAEILNLHDGKEYREFFDKLPIPESVAVHKDWLYQKNADQILSRAGMSARPEYYSGRGATLSDLNAKILESVYDMILGYIGKDAANEFVKMVQYSDMSATEFVRSMFALERNNWVYKNNEKNPQGKGVAYNDEFTALATLVSSLGARADDTEQIRGPFLRKRGIAQKQFKSFSTEKGMYIQLERH